MLRIKSEPYLADADTGIIDLMRRIDVNDYKILFIVDHSKRLVGSLTDGDIRRWIIKNGSLNGTAVQIMNNNPKFLFDKDIDRAKIYMKRCSIYAVPILDADEKIVHIIFKNGKSVAEKTYMKKALANTPVIVMAGGKGTRLYPYTKILPKPLIPIGGVPILERILDKFAEYGAKEFYLTLNYKKEIIKAYFYDLKPKYNIHYVEEDKPLGTAGSIRLIDDKFNEPVIVTNCDILIESDYSSILEHHKKSQNSITIVSSVKNITIPYGVLRSEEDGIISSMEEKPELSYFINTGMYIVNPKALEKIPLNQVYHMTHLSEQLIKEGFRVGMYPVSENSFLDMGQFEEMKKMEEKINKESD